MITTTAIQKLHPGAYAFHAESGSFERVLAYPIVTSTHVYVDVTGGGQIVGRLDDAVDVAHEVWAD